MRLLLAILLCTSLSKADFILGHGLTGFSLFGGTAKVLGCDNQTSRIIGFIGAGLTMLPDLEVSYPRYLHHNLAWIPPVGLHQSVDNQWHGSDGKWKWDRWPVFVVVWVCEIVLAYVIWKWTE